MLRELFQPSKHKKRGCGRCKDKQLDRHRTCCNLIRESRGGARKKKETSQETGKKKKKLQRQVVSVGGRLPLYGLVPIKTAVSCMDDGGVWMHLQDNSR